MLHVAGKNGAEMMKSTPREIVSQVVIRTKLIELLGN